MKRSTKIIYNDCENLKIVKIDDIIGKYINSWVYWGSFSSSDIMLVNIIKIEE